MRPASLRTPGPAVRLRLRWSAVWRRDERRRLRRGRLGADGPPHDPDQVEDRELEDEHQKDDLDHPCILGAFDVMLLVAGPGWSFRGKDAGSARIE
jgi:hypothetical protein